VLGVPQVETTVQEEDTQPITQPIVAPIKQKEFDVTEPKNPETKYKTEFLLSLMHHPHLVRNIAVIGHLHHGKTCLVDNLVALTHQLEPARRGHQGKAGKREVGGLATERRYTDSRVDEQKRGLSIKASPVSLLLQSSTEKHFLFNLIDTPGHVNFQDEVTAALRLADGVLLVVDVVEGVMANTERLIRHALAERLRIVLCVNKMDRLMLELKLHPTDAYFKVRQVIEEANDVISGASGGDHPRLSPDDGSVIFASSQLNWCFSLHSFASVYADFYPDVRPEPFARRLWGDVYFQPEARTFRRKPPPGGGPRTFVQFVLEPLYKLVTQAISASETDLKATLGDLGLPMRKDEYRLDPKPLLKVVMSRFLGESYCGLVDSCVRHLPSPVAAARAKVEHTYTGDLTEQLVEGMLGCAADGLLMVNVTKMYHKPDCESFDAFGRVLSGTLRVGQQVNVLGETYSLEDQEDSAKRTVARLWIYQVRQLSEPRSPQLPRRDLTRGGVWWRPGHRLG
jgi:U5 small nuclear ribonucleoprotein component